MGQVMRKESPDEAHEARILDCYERWREGNASWAELVQLIERRSAEKIRQMEQERGLA